jgi:hypothetical protein
MLNCLVIGGGPAGLPESYGQAEPSQLVTEAAIVNEHNG